MRFVCLSDTHLRQDGIAVPEGDVLIHAGDFTRRGSLEEIEAVDRWLATLPHRHKILVAGNHDLAFESTPGAARARVHSATYLEDGEATVGGLRVWGSPWQPWYFDWAFNCRRGPDIRAKWDLIPAGIDVLVTHGPPMGVLDRTHRGESVGCADLTAAVARVAPRAHVFGHIHEACGSERRDGVLYLNAAICDLRFQPINPPRVFDLEPGGEAVPVAPPGDERLSAVEGDGASPRPAGSPDLR